MYPLFYKDHTRPPSSGIPPWETKRYQKRSTPEYLRFEPPAQTLIPPPAAPPPEPIVRTGGHAGWLARLFRRPAKVAAV